MNNNIDLAGKKFWNSQWSDLITVQPIDVSDKNLRNYQRQNFHQLFLAAFSDLQSSDKKLIELGCANSMWLPYFAKEMGFQVTGLDYSEKGCALEKRILSEMDIDGEIICADFFAPPEDCIGKYDALISFGVAEHFTDTAGCLQSFSMFLKPGGMIFTLIPNMVGVLGTIAKIINRPFYDLHMIIDAESLADSHRRAGFVNVQANYFMSVNFGVLNNFNGIEKGSIKWVINKTLLFGLQGITALVWLFENMLMKFRPSRAFSPYIVCTGIKEK